LEKESFIAILKLNKTGNISNRQIEHFFRSS